MWFEFEFECRWWRDSGGVVGPRKCTLNTLSAESAVLEPSEPLPTINGRRYPLTSHPCMSLYCCCARCTLYWCGRSVQCRTSVIPHFGLLWPGSPTLYSFEMNVLNVSVSMWSLGWTEFIMIDHFSYSYIKIAFFLEYLGYNLNYSVSCISRWKLNY